MNLVERFKTERIAINCETEQEANKFIDWCYDNGLEFYNGKKTYFSEYLERTCYSYNYCGDCKLEYGIAEFYDEENWKIIKYKDYFKEGIKMKNFDKYMKDILIDSNEQDYQVTCWWRYKYLGERTDTECSCDDCTECQKQFFEWLNQEYKEPIKLTQFEYDMLSTTSKYHLWLGELKNGLYYIKMKEKGYFKNVDLSMTAKEVLENCEVVENVD